MYTRSVVRCIVAFAILTLGIETPYAAQAQTAYALTGLGNALVSFDLATPGTVTTIGNFTGATTNLTDIDFRVSDGLLYGYDQINNQIVTINTATAATTFVSNLSVGSNVYLTTGIDFNPVADRLRIVNGVGQNLRVNVADGTTIVDGTLTYAPGDPSAGGPFFTIAEAAYTNNDNDPATGTSLYYIDENVKTLVTTTNPNSGVLNTVGSLGINGDFRAGFDIFTNANGTNSAYAIAAAGAGLNNNDNLYSISLGTGAASLIGSIGRLQITGFAIKPLATAVPEPGSVALLVGLFVTGAGFLRCRRSRK